MTKNHFSVKIDLSLKEKLYKHLEEQNFSFSKPQYTIFSAKSKNLIITLFESGSLVVQGKESKEFIEFYLEPEILKSFVYTNPKAFLDYSERIGVDEAGKGDYFGPLCVGALCANKESIESLCEFGVQDSKKLSDSKIITLASKIKKKCPYSIITLNPVTYNKLYSKFKNLNYLLAWAHSTAIETLVKKTGCKKVIIDQFADKQVVESFVKKKKLEIDLEQRVRGEEDIVVAGASILARDGFLTGMDKLSEKFGIILQKGASSIVTEMAKSIYLKFGIDGLNNVAKMHFKTTKEVVK